MPVVVPVLPTGTLPVHVVPGGLPLAVHSVAVAVALIATDVAAPLPTGSVHASAYV